MSFGALLGQRPSSGGMTAEILVEKDAKITDVAITNPKGEDVGVDFVDNYFIAKVDEYGEYKVDITLGQEMAKRIISVNACKQFIVDKYSPILNENVWSVIREASDLNKASALWSVGDAKEITLNGTIRTISLSNYKTWVYILGFNHNSEVEGNNMIHFGCFRNGQEYSETNSICLIDGEGGFAYHNINMNYGTSSDNGGGWNRSDMRTGIINADATSPSDSTGNTFLHALPDDLKVVMKKCTKKDVNTSGTAYNASISNTTNWAFLLSECEVFGKISNGFAEEESVQKQYEYYTKGNSKIKYKYNSKTGALGGATYWWLRTVDKGNDTNFCDVNFEGNASAASSNDNLGFAPAFCV